MCGLLAERVAMRRKSNPPVSFERRVLGVTTATLLIFVAAAKLNAILYDRYVWLVVLAGSMLILARFKRRAGASHWPATVVGVSLTVIAVAVAANSAAFDGAQWRAGAALVRAGMPAQQIDGGFAWVGAHQPADAKAGGAFPAPSKASWWSELFPMPLVCSYVAASRLPAPPGAMLVAQPRWGLLGIGDGQRLYVYRSHLPGCPP